MLPIIAKEDIGLAGWPNTTHCIDPYDTHLGPKSERQTEEGGGGGGRERERERERGRLIDNKD